jgi:hypothetical protein
VRAAQASTHLKLYKVEKLPTLRNRLTNLEEMVSFRHLALCALTLAAAVTASPIESDFKQQPAALEPWMKAHRNFSLQHEDDVKYFVCQLNKERVKYDLPPVGYER